MNHEAEVDLSKYSEQHLDGIPSDRAVSPAARAEAGVRIAEYVAQEILQRP